MKAAEIAQRMRDGEIFYADLDYPEKIRLNAPGQYATRASFRSALAILGDDAWTNNGSGYGSKLAQDLKQARAKIAEGWKFEVVFGKPPALVRRIELHPEVARLISLEAKP